MSSTETLLRPETSTNTGDHDRFTHVVRRPFGRVSAAEVVTEAIIHGIPVEALCGKKWVPSRDPGKYPVCPECAELAAKIIKSRK